MNSIKISTYREEDVEIESGFTEVEIINWFEVSSITEN
jgi:hypothetical protein